MASLGYLARVALEVQRLVKYPKHLEHWQSCIREWAKSEEAKPCYETVSYPIKVNGTTKIFEREYLSASLPLVPLQRTIGYMYTLFGAVSDVFSEDTEDNSAIRIDPFPRGPVRVVVPTHKEVKEAASRGAELIVKKQTPEEVAEAATFVQGASYAVMMFRIQEGEIQEVELPLLNQFLDDIKRDLATVAADHEPVPDECHVTLLQMAAIVNKSKRTLRRLRDDGKLPAPDVKGGKGRADEWLWSSVRPILNEEYSRKVLETFPSDRFVRR